MRILVLSLMDSGGGCGKLARAIHEHPDHQAKAARWRMGRIVNYPDSERFCIWQPDKARTLKLIEWSQAVIVTGPWRGLPKALPWGTRSLIPPGASRRPMVVNYRGTPYRQNRADYDHHDRRAKVLQSGNFLDLLASSRIRHWLPVPVWADELKWYQLPYKGSRFIVVQAVTQAKRFHLKNVAGVRKQLRNLSGVDFDLVHGLPHEECLRHIGVAGLVITAFKNGYGNSGLEAMAMGIPTVGDGFDGYIAEVERQVGYLPFYRAKVGYLKQVVMLFRDKPELRKIWSDIGKLYIDTYHSARAVAEKAVELCQMAG